MLGDIYLSPSGNFYVELRSAQSKEVSTLAVYRTASDTPAVLVGAPQDYISAEDCFVGNLIDMLKKL